MNPNDELAIALGGDEPDFEDEPRSPLDLDQATQWLAQVSQIRAKRQEYRDALDAANARMRAKADEAFAKFDKNEAWFTEALAIFHRTAIAIDPAATRISTPAGDLTSNAGQQKWVYEDEAALLEWAMVNMDAAVDFPPAPPARLKKAELKKALKENEDTTFSDGVVLLDGAIVPGVKVLPAVRSFDPKPSE